MLNPQGLLFLNLGSQRLWQGNCSENMMYQNIKYNVPTPLTSKKFVSSGCNQNITKENFQEKYLEKRPNNSYYQCVSPVSPHKVLAPVLMVCKTFQIFS